MLPYRDQHYGTIALRRILTIIFLVAFIFLYKTYKHSSSSRNYIVENLQHRKLLEISEQLKIAIQGYTATNYGAHTQLIPEQFNKLKDDPDYRFNGTTYHAGDHVLGWALFNQQNVTLPAFTSTSKKLSISLHFLYEKLREDTNNIDEKFYFIEFQLKKAVDISSLSTHDEQEVLLATGEEFDVKDSNIDVFKQFIWDSQEDLKSNWEEYHQNDGLDLQGIIDKIVDNSNWEYYKLEQK